MKHILVVGGHEEIFKMMEGLDVLISIFQISDQTSDFQRSLAYRLYEFDYTNEDKSLLHAKVLNRTMPIDGVVSFTEFGLEPAALIKQKLGIEGNSFEAVKLSRNKTDMRKHLFAKGICTVKFLQSDRIEDIETFFKVVGNPIIIKPAKGSGSSGVHYVDDISQIKNRHTASIAEYGGEIIAEEFLVGEEYSIETMTKDGAHELLAITEKITTGSPRFIELGHQLPARLSDAEYEECRDLIVKLLNAIGHTLGPCHIEVMKTNSGFKIIEMNTRPGGDFIWEMVLKVTGVNLVRETMIALAGLNPEARQQKAPAAAVRFIAFENKTITQIRSIDNALLADNDIVRFHCSLKKGDVIGPLKSSDDRQGFIVGTGHCIEQAISKTSQGLDSLKVEYQNTN